ncbi:DUF397 domain-containing protein [Actinomadura fulvescens]|uniref:DUF397 domain-containing protein n=1 Tax=Actinomadura fulvescens TaxID=46160 RepID=A0ABN3QM38_9ACTN
MSDAVWRKARRSNDAGGDCIELARLAQGVGLRDSKDPDGPKLTLTRNALADLLEAARQA